MSGLPSIAESNLSMQTELSTATLNRSTSEFFDGSFQVIHSLIHWLRLLDNFPNFKVVFVFLCLSPSLFLTPSISNFANMRQQLWRQRFPQPPVGGTFDYTFSSTPEL
jgi:hypothetical protein